MGDLGSFCNFSFKESLSAMTWDYRAFNSKFLKKQDFMSFCEDVVLSLS